MINFNRTCKSLASYFQNDNNLTMLEKTETMVYETLEK